MKAKHTHGPWHRTGTIKGAINTNDKHIAMVNFSHHGSISDVFGEEYEANAKLIAAAPELLEVCVKCLIHLEVSEIELGLQEDLKNTIKKATG